MMHLLCPVVLWEKSERGAGLLSVPGGGCPLHESSGDHVGSSNEMSVSSRWQQRLSGESGLPHLAGIEAASLLLPVVCRRKPAQTDLNETQNIFMYIPQMSRM